MAASAVALRGSLRSHLRVTAVHTPRSSARDPSSWRRTGLRPRPVRRDDGAPWSYAMTINMVHLSPIISILAGILILIMPRLLNYIVAIYLIVVGIIGLGIFK